MRKVKKGLIRGRSAAFLVSLGIHVALLIVAGGFVVFNIVRPEPKVFEPVEEIDRPKMKLKKLQVKVKENSRPRDSTERITTKTTLVTEDIQLPAMGGIGDGLGGAGVGGFDIMADMEEMTLMGGQASVGNDLIGTYYYFQQLRDGSDSNLRGWENAEFETVLRDFFRKGWDPAVFSRYWRAPTKLYATQFFVPSTISAMGPEYFGDHRLVEAAHWLVHYKGKISHKKGGRFRFWGTSDDFLYVRINGRTVLDASYPMWRDRNFAEWIRYAPADDRKYPVTWNNRFRWYVGNWFEIEPGEPVEMEVLLGEEPGGEFWAMLAVQEEGVEYPERPDLPGPLLPVFKTAPMPQHLKYQIEYMLAPGVVDLTNNLTFNRY